MSAGIGNTLRETRQARKLELAEVHEVTKVSVRYLKALEDEDWGALPGPAYVRGFLSTYAEFLGLDAESLLGQLDLGREAEALHLREPIIESGELPGSRRIPNPWAVLGALAAIVLILAVLLGGDDDVDGPAEENLVERTTPAEVPEATGGTTEQMPDPEADSAQRSNRVEVRLRATGAVWVCLVDQRNRELVEAETLAEGERRGPFEARRFRLSLGNGQAQVRADGEPIDVPQSSDPLGFEITRSGTEPLPPAQRPECV